MLRSSSTPILGSLLSSLSSESPNNNYYNYPHGHGHETNPSSKLSFGYSSQIAFPCSSSPISPSIALDGEKGICRAQSDGNLQGLAYAPCNSDSNGRKLSTRNRSLMLETIPSFSYYNSRGELQDEEDESDIECRLEGEDEFVMAIGIGNRSMLLAEEEKVSYQKTWEVGFNGGFAHGIGGGGGDFNRKGSGGDGDGDGGENKHGIEEYYKKMVEENPSNPLFLRNYAEFLNQCKQDLKGAEEYYGRAILADPEDGEILSQYGKFIWQQHHDKDRAACYYERAVQASPLNSHVHAEHASFLWEAEEDDGECSVPPSGPGPDSIIPQRFGVMASANF